LKIEKKTKTLASFGWQIAVY